MMSLRWLAAIFCLAIFAIASSAPARAAVRDSGASHLMEPPRTDGAPVKVSVALHILNLSNVNEVTERFEISAYLIIQWNDPRLAYTPDSPWDTSRSYSPGLFWIPRLVLLNSTTPRQTHERSLILYPSGQVEYAEHFNATLSSNFHLRRFPFDEQTLVVLVHPFYNQQDDILFVPRQNPTWLAAELVGYSSLASWQLDDLKAGIATAPARFGTKISEANFSIRVTRRYGFYLWKVFLPLTMMVILSWAVFWIDPFDLDNQIQVAITTILTIIAFAFAISSTLPRIPYLTYTDAFFLNCYIFVFVAILELMTVHVVHREEKTELGLRIRRISRWAVPSAFVLVNALIFCDFLL